MRRMNFVILRVAKLKTMGAIAGSGRHTFREIDTPAADPERTTLNKMAGSTSTAQLLDAVRDRLPEKRRKDAVLCLEYLISASPEWFGDDWRETQNTWFEYFSDALNMLQQKHGEGNVVCANVQLDEKTPHMVVYVVPRTPDGRLSAKEFVGGRAKLRALQTEFAARVGVRHGLIRGVEGTKAIHMTPKQFYARIAANPQLKPPVGPPEPSVMDVASGRALKAQREHFEEMTVYSALVERTANVARLGAAARKGQAKAISQIRSELPEIHALEAKAAKLQQQLDKAKHIIEEKIVEAARLHTNLNEAEKVISAQAEQLSKFKSMQKQQKNSPEL